QAILDQGLWNKAAVWFVSAEPLLGPIDFKFALGWIDWVIVGGESGAGARPMHPDWAGAIQKQCAAAKVAFFFKQWGEWAPASAIDPLLPLPRKVPHEYMNHAGICRPVDSTYIVNRVGKERAGRLLDGKEYSEFPHM